MKLTEEECEDIAAKIDSEGFDYYFTDYGADAKVEKLIGREISNYIEHRSNLINALADLGIEIEL